MKNAQNGYKQFEVAFTENTNKYNNITRSIGVQAINNYQAEMITHQTFGSFKSTHPILTPSDKIKINSCVEVKEDLVEVGGAE